MKDKLQKILNSFEDDIKKVTNYDDLEKLRVEYLSKKGYIPQIMPMLRDIPNDQKREVGQLVNSVKNQIEDGLKNTKQVLDLKEIEKTISNSEKIDITLPVNNNIGSLHPRTTIQKEIEDIFIGMGFSVEDGKEVETEYNNFDAVNVPKNHPARDMQDTFWLDNGELLKTHTSASQNRILRKYNGPLKAIFPGRCFRNEALDHSHENTFFQIEGMVVDKDVSVANLIFFMKEMLSLVFKKDIEVRLRPGFFPFTEPSFELDIKCPFCNGKGCSTCKNGGWIELCPCGMIHPNVLRNGGLDPEQYSGFAFGLGYDRLVMMKDNLNDIRLLNSGNLKLLKQFGIK